MTQPGTVYLIPTVLADDTASDVIPAQVANCVSNLTYFLVENARTARRYIKTVCPHLVIEELQIVVIDKNSSDDEVRKALKPVLEGKSAGIISAAGCPGVADPGAEIVKHAHRSNIKVVPLVGP